jgi:hypothetical protein
MTAFDITMLMITFGTVTFFCGYVLGLWIGRRYE